MPNTVERKLERSLKLILGHLGITRIPGTTDSELRTRVQLMTGWTVGEHYSCQHCFNHDLSCEVSGLSASAHPASMLQLLPHVPKNAYRWLVVTLHECERCASFTMNPPCVLKQAGIVFSKNAPHEGSDPGTQDGVGWVLDTDTCGNKEPSPYPVPFECRQWGEGVERALNDAWDTTARIQMREALYMKESHLRPVQIIKAHISKAQ